MFSAISLLVLACAIAVNAQGPSQCSESKIGVVPTAHAVKLQPVVLEPGILDWQVIIPPIPECVAGVSGVQSYICDIDTVPTGYFVDFNKLQVHRTGRTQGYGSVTVTVYCN